MKNKEKCYADELRRCKENIAKTKKLIVFHKDMLKKMERKEAEVQAKLDGADVCEVENLVNKAFEVFEKNPCAHIDPISLYRYHLYASERYTDEIFPDSIKENGIICERCLHLGTFLAKEYSDNVNKIITRGYDVVYDLKSEEMMLLYRVMYSDNSVVTIYRVETEYFEDFDVTGFMLDFTSQIAGKLKQNGNVILGEAV